MRQGRRGLKEEFKVPSTFDHEAMRSEAEWLETRFHAMVDGELAPRCIPALLRNLVRQQRPRLASWIPEGSWCVVPDPAESDLPSDARFHYMDGPTLHAAGIMARAIVYHPKEAAQVPEMPAALHKALRFLAARNFHGHGYDKEGTEMAWVYILHEGCIIDYVADHPGECAEFLAVLRRKRDEFQHRIDTGNTSGGWDEDYHDDFVRAVAYLAPVD
ncbi:MAG: hypothetical protein Q6353_005760 [Candidatus Sigynarchaeum springense]